MRHEYLDIALSTILLLDVTLIDSGSSGRLLGICPSSQSYIDMLLVYVIDDILIICS